MGNPETSFGPYGLFWDIGSVNDFESTLSNSTPPLVQQCSEAKAALDNMYALRADIAETVSQMMEDSEYSDIQISIAPETVRKISYIFGPDAFDEKQLTALEDIVSFGLHNYLTGDDLVILALHRSYLADTDAFLSSFLTVVSLDVARELHFNNIENGGIRPNFDVFTDWAEDAIISGEIVVRGAGVDDLASAGLATASYRPSSKEIILPPADDNTIVALLAGVIVHECYHAYQDKDGEGPETVIDVELPAHEVGKKIDVLLDRAYGFDFDERSAYVAQLDEEAALQADKFGDSLARCYGYEDWYYKWSDWKTQQETSDALRQATIMELEGEAGGNFQAAWEEWYKGFVFMQAFGNLTGMMIDALLVASQSQGNDPRVIYMLKLQLQQISEAISTCRGQFEQAPRNTQERAEAASRYLDALIKFKIIAGYLYGSASNNYYDEFSRNVYPIGESLLYTSYK